MNIRLLTLITIFSLCCIFSFGKLSYSLNKVNQDDISELKILKYLPKNNKTLFISNSQISNIANDIKKRYETKKQDELILIKNSLLAYLGINLSTNKLEEIYNNELIITSHDNETKDKDDILIIFKIKDKKNIDDLLNLTNKIDQTDKLIKILRENKLNYLNYIYRTNDNYVITSSNKNLIIDALQSRNISNKLDEKFYPYQELLENFKNEHNILITKNFKINQLLNNETYSLIKEDNLVTTFNFKDKNIILKSYLINNNRSLDINSYKNIDKDNTLDNESYQISIYNNFKNKTNYIDLIKISTFEKAIFNELNKKLKQNMLFLNSDNNWYIVFDKNKLSVENIKLLEDFNKNSLENNNNIYTIYSKDKLKVQENIIKNSSYEKIFTIQSKNLTFISNSLINDEDVHLISNAFFNFRDDRYSKYFLNKKMHFKNLHSNKLKNFSFLEKINYFLNSTIDISIVEFKETIKESIPEILPIYYAETNLKIL